MTYSGPDRAAFILRPDEIIRAVTNLVQNATRFGTEVDVALLMAGDGLVVDVSDDGPGIPDERKAAMLEPFVRGEEARTMDETSGFGLGLSIAQAIVTAHHGTLQLLDNAPKGLRVRLQLSKIACDNSSPPRT